MKSIDYSRLWDQLSGSSLSGWIPELQELVKANIFESNNGHLAAWMNVLNSLPVIKPESYDLHEAVRFDFDKECGDLENRLKVLNPWRKGPIKLRGLTIDTEWRSDWKWDRLKNQIAPLQDRTVLDIGCGNGYYLWRMVGAGARLAIGIDPFLLFVMQFWTIKHFAPEELPAWALPLGWEDLPQELPFFDTVFSMGVLYHRRNPVQFLQQLKNYVRPSGELILETLVIEGKEGDVLVPEGRYAKMGNVWYIPSVPTLELALTDAGWENVRCIDVTATTVEEQRSTEWMTFESLTDFLDPRDYSKTIEGYPAPKRAIVLANKAGR